MNKDLQYILDFIERVEHLTEKEKADLLKSVKNADKELTISEFKLERTDKVKKTTAILLEETIAELEQKRKDVEKHNRELEIEAALERVRARTMAMQDSSELAEASTVLFQQLKMLGILSESARAFFSLFDTETKISNVWTTKEDGLLRPGSHQVPLTGHQSVKNVFKAWKAKKSFYVRKLSGDTLLDYLKFLSSLPHIKEDITLKQLTVAPPELLVLSEAFNAYGTVGIISFTPLDTEAQNVLIRFAKVFEQTYTRFLDLQKAEAQAREATIEAALERVRARSMAMHRSDELKDVIKLLYKEFRLLVADFNVVSIQLNLDSSRDLHFWSGVEEDIYPERYHWPASDLPVFDHIDKAWKSRDGFLDLSFNREEKDAFFREVFKIQPVPPNRRKMLQGIEGMIMMGWFLKYSGIHLMRYNLSPFNEEEKKIVRRFSAAFEQTYIRFLDLQKAEAQAREAQIEAALERVRSRTMAMHQSNELADTAAVLFRQLIDLGIAPNRIYISTIRDAKGTAETWITDEDGSKVSSAFTLHLNENRSFKKMLRGWKEKKKSIIIDMKGQELEEYFQHLGQLHVPFKEGLAQKRRIQYIAYFSHGFIGIAAPELQPEIINLLERFAAVFNLTYRRFLDLQQAEAQAREAQIELALERIRARTMAMQHSDELAETANVLFQQFSELGEEPDQLSIGTVNEAEKVCELWVSVQGNQVNRMYRVPISEPIVMNKIYKAWKKQKKSLVVDISGDELEKYKDFRNSLPDFKTYNDIRNSKSKEEHRRVIYCAFFPQGLLSLATPEPRPAETIKILERFARVFDLTYTRFLDLQKAEAQAREAQIEAALERVRARTMAMHRSDELSETAAVLFQQLNDLGIDPERIFIGIVHEDAAEVEFWVTEQGGSQISNSFSARLDEETTIAKTYSAWKAKKPTLVIDLFGKELMAWIRYLREQLGMPLKEEYLREHRIHSIAFFSQGMIGITTPDKRPAETMDILKRFTRVFEQTYTRFLDLQKAEEQAREAQIEAALERVRAKAMAMHRSDDLALAVAAVFEELEGLGLKTLRCGIGIIDGRTRRADIWTTVSTDKGDSVQVAGDEPLEGHPLLEGIFESWKHQQDLSYILQGEDLRRFYRVVGESNFQLPASKVTSKAPRGAQQYYYGAMFQDGGLYAFRETEFSAEAIRVMRRFADVFHLAYTRYEDLQKAEARALEAEQQASLDRVRAEIASMRTAEDLQRITPLIWRELTTLGVPFFRCGIFIVDEAAEEVRVYLSTPTGKAVAALHLKFAGTTLVANTVQHWRDQKVYREEWDREQFKAWTKSLIEQGQIKSPEKYQAGGEAPGKLVLQFVPFEQGMLYIGSSAPLSDDEIDIGQALATAFGVAYARYEDFQRLELAKKEVEAALEDLKKTQTQLVHAEKLASLGQLTAGIAHEIKNPLNFVNNFAELSTELVQELREEIEKWKSEIENPEEIAEILNDLEQNAKKINDHGKRADSIVKGMLQHSRGKTGERQPTDINAMLEEDLNLAYHGMRAQDSSFNITIEKDFDETLGKIEVVPQNISRVFLNIITNGFYAVHQRRQGQNFSPKLLVQTRLVDNNAEIRIKDNGSGIPTDVREKIFQPFFTTKPTGQGTGLGLSISYDIIVQEHHGKIRVASREGEFTEFIITLPVNANYR